MLGAAAAAGLHVVEWRLCDGIQGPRRPNAPYWLGVKRFDRTAKGRLHFASAAGLLDADFRTPCLDYEMLLRMTAALCSTQDVVEMLRRAVFNFMVCNADDHAKNFGFLPGDDGAWRLSPAFDLTFSPSPNGEHTTSFFGEGRSLTKRAAARLQKLVGLSASEMRGIAEAVAAGAETVGERAAALGMKKTTAKRIDAAVKAAVKTNLAAFAA